MAIGAIIVGVFAVVWVAAGTRELRRERFLGLTTLAVVVSAALVYLASHHPPAYRFRFNVVAYNLAVGLEVLGIIIAVVLLRRRDRPDLILPVISIVVGLHFFGMIPALGWNGYAWIAAAMCVWPVLVLLLFPRKWWLPMTGIGCAVILWSSILFSMRFS